MRTPRGRPPPGRVGKKGALKDTLGAELAVELERLIGAAAGDFQALETAARRVALQFAAKAVAAHFDADRSDEAGAHLPCGCGAMARRAGRRAKTFTTALGEMPLERAWYQCDACGHGFAPRDRELGFGNGALSPAVLRMVGMAAAQVSFGSASGLLRDLAGLDIDPKTVERHAEALGRTVAADERDVVEPEPRAAYTLYLGLDGTGVPVRKDATAGRPGKQPDGTAKTREAKLAVVWSAATNAADGAPVRDPDSVSYNAAIESVAVRDTDTAHPPFVHRVLRETQRRRFDQAPRRVVLGDGAAWIWNLAEEHFPGAIQIVDIFHAKEHLFEVAKALYGADTDLAREWGKQRRDELDQGRIDDLLDALRGHAATCADAAKCADYIARNRERMRYPAFRAAGLCVATGVVEGACKNLVGGRLKRAGMHWSVNGANAILALRCAVLGNRFDDFWERRAAAKTLAKPRPISQI